MTAPQPGAIAVLQLVGDTLPVLAKVTGLTDWPIGRPQLAPLGDIDRGIGVRLRDDVAQLMPHGGLRVVQRLSEYLQTLGVELVGDDSGALRRSFPEADDDFDALAMQAIAGARSPLAIDLLADQPRRWRETTDITSDDQARSMRLNHLLDPPLVVLAGPPNVGKSTLTNTLHGRMKSITADAPGTTRDYTSGHIDLAGLVIDFHDTPGIRHANDPIEAKAIELAGQLCERAAFVIAMTDADHDWPPLTKTPDLRIANKCDLARRSDADLNISALTGSGLAQLTTTIRDRLVWPGDLEHPGPWVFDEQLVAAIKD